MDAAFRNAVAAARREGGLFFAGLLSQDRILQAFGDARWKWQGWIYTPAVTVWTFLSQCLSPDQSCRDAVARLMAWRLARGMHPCSPETGAYCTARGQLPEEACSQLVRETGRQVDDAAPPDWRWLGRRVLNVDGSTIKMPDTEANQAEYPQQSSQAGGCGFPIARIVVIFSLAVGAVLDAAIGKYQGKQTGENSLFRTLHNTLRNGDVVLADRYFSGWFDIALLQQQGVDVVIRKHQLRRTDFRLGVRLGPDDQLVCWRKPPRPDWMSHEQYHALPETLTMREVRIRVTQRGFRTRNLVVVTTLLDSDQYPASEIAALYQRRWQAEIHLRSLKSVLQIDHLRCKTPERVRNEFYMHLVGYNLIRELMATAAFRAGVSPWTISFKGALQTINNLAPLLTSRITTTEWCEAVLNAIATHEVGHRPDRVEPRVVKRRPKPYKLMTRPRREYKRRAA
ncbi:MAG TPA: IS4 family transposase [Pirellulales bacterium]|nr:IS4 family transposase [Pirellulales bacterium]